MIAGELSVMAEVNLLKHNHKCFKCDHGLLFLSVSGLVGGSTVWAWQSRFTMLPAISGMAGCGNIGVAILLLLKFHWLEGDHMVSLSCKGGWEM